MKIRKHKVEKWHHLPEVLSEDKAGQTCAVKILVREPSRMAWDTAIADGTAEYRASHPRPSGEQSDDPLEQLRQRSRDPWAAVEDKAARIFAIRRLRPVVGVANLSLDVVASLRAAEEAILRADPQGRRLFRGLPLDPLLQKQLDAAEDLLQEAPTERGNEEDIEFLLADDDVAYQIALIASAAPVHRLQEERRLLGNSLAGSVEPAHGPNGQPVSERPSSGLSEISTAPGGETIALKSSA